MVYVGGKLVPESGSGNRKAPGHPSVGTSNSELPTNIGINV